MCSMVAFLRSINRLVRYLQPRPGLYRQHYRQFSISTNRRHCNTWDRHRPDRRRYSRRASYRHVPVDKSFAHCYDRREWCISRWISSARYVYRERPGLVSFVHGTPLLIVDNGDLQNTDNAAAERPNFVQGQSMFISNPSPAKWFNTAAFVPSVLSYGNVPRNPGGLYGPGTKTFDLSLSRSFPLPFHENSLMFRAEFFNAFNTPQFGRPGATVGTTSFGKITSTSGSEPNRIIQLALKYNF